MRKKGKLVLIDYECTLIYIKFNNVKENDKVDSKLKIFWKT